MLFSGIESPKRVSGASQMNFDDERITKKIFLPVVADFFIFRERSGRRRRCKRSGLDKKFPRKFLSKGVWGIPNKRVQCYHCALLAGLVKLAKMPLF